MDPVTQLSVLLSRGRAALLALCWIPVVAARCALLRRESCVVGAAPQLVAVAPGWSASKGTRTRRTSWESVPVRATMKSAEPMG